MATQLDMTSPLNFFLSFMTMLHNDVLTKFIIPGLNVSYWDLCISFAVVGVVIAALISSIRIGSVIGFRGFSTKDYPVRGPIHKGWDGKYYDGEIDPEPSGNLSQGSGLAKWKWW